MIRWKSSDGSGGSKGLPVPGWGRDADLRSLQSQLLDNATLSTQYGSSCFFLEDIVKLLFTSSRGMMAMLRISRKPSLLLWPAVLVDCRSDEVVP